MMRREEVLVVLLVLGALGVGYFLGGGSVGNGDVLLSPVSFGHDWGDISGVPADLLDGDDGVVDELDPTVLDSVKDGVSWDEISGKSSFACRVDKTNCVDIHERDLQNSGCPQSHPILNRVQFTCGEGGCASVNPRACCALSCS